MSSRSRFLVIAMVLGAVLLLMMPGVAAAQEGLEGDPVLARFMAAPEDYYPLGDLPDTAPFFAFPAEENPNITWYNVVVNDGATTILDEWYEASAICDEGNCFVLPGVVLHGGIGDKALSWTLRGYNASTSAITDINTNAFTIIAAKPIGPSTITSLSGSGQFVLESVQTELNAEPQIYHVVVIQDSTNAVVIDEWVYRDELECDPEDPEDCVVYLDQTQEPVYENGNYTAWFQGLTQPAYFDYTAWSEGFHFTVDITSAETPTVFPVIADDLIYLDIYNEQALEYLVCEGAFECSTAQPYFVFRILDHGQFVAIELDSSRLQMMAEPITDATQWFEYRIKQGATLLKSEWINTYTDPRCFYYDEEILPVCIVQTDELANGNYTVEWQSYNPGGLSGYDSDDFAINVDQQKPVVSTDVELDYVLINIDTGSYAPPQWAEILVTDTSDGSVAYNEWIEVSGAAAFYEAYYEIMFSGGDYYDIIETLRGQIICVEGCEGILDVYLENGNYEIEVRTWAYGDLSEYSDPVALVINNAVPTIPLAPGDMSVMRIMPTVTGNSRPIYGWSASEGTSWHNLVVENAGGVVFDGWYHTYDICEVDDSIEELSIGELRIARAPGDQMCEAHPAVDLPAGDYTWKVRGWSNGGMGSFSPAQNMTISSVPLTIPEPITPDGDSSHIPQFSWTVVENASWYEIYVENTGTNTIVYDEWIYVPAFECTTECEYNAPYSVQFLTGNYEWRIRAANGSAASGWSSTQSFVVDGFNSDIELIEPTSDYYSGDITFYWLPSPATTWYNLELYLDDDNVLEGESSAIEASTLVYSEWFNAELLNEVCHPVWVQKVYDTILISPPARVNQAAPPDLPIYCELELADADFSTGLYYWKINSWGPTFGSEVYEDDEIGLFWWQ